MAIALLFFNNIITSCEFILKMILKLPIGVEPISLDYESSPQPLRQGSTKNLPKMSVKSTFTFSVIGLFKNP